MPTREAQPGVRPRTDHRTRIAAATDFGGVVQRPPLAVVMPRSAEQVVTARDQARASGVHVTVRGTGHGVAGACTGDGWVMDMRNLGGVNVGADHAVVGAAVPWETLLLETLERGLMPPVVPDSLALSVVGTAIAGGHGEAGLRFGTVADSVTAIEYVVDDTVEISDGAAARQILARRRDGEDIVVTRVTVPLIRVAERHARVAVLEGNVRDLIDMAVQHGGVADGVGIECMRRGGGFVGELRLRLAASAQVPAGFTSETLPWLMHLDRAAPVAEHRRHCANPWFSAVVGRAGLGDVLTCLEHEPDGLLGARGRVVLRPLLDSGWLADAIRVIEPPRPDTVALALAANGVLASTVHRVGGDIYRAATVLSAE